MPGDRAALDRRAVMAGLFTVAGGVAALLAPEGASAWTVAGWGFWGGFLTVGTYALWDTYRRNVTNIDSDPETAPADDGDTDEDGSFRPMRFLGFAEGTLKLSPCWVIIGVAPLFISTDPVPGFVFPIVGVVGFYLTHRLYEGPLAVP